MSQLQLGKTLIVFCPHDMDLQREYLLTEFDGCRITAMYCDECAEEKDLEQNNKESEN
jgi:hypothetical protein